MSYKNSKSFKFFNDEYPEEVEILFRELPFLSMSHGDITWLFDTMLDVSIDKSEVSENIYYKEEVILDITGSNEVGYNGSGEYASEESTTNLHIRNKEGDFLCEVYYTIDSAHCSESQLLSFEVLVDEAEQKEKEPMANLSTRVNKEETKQSTNNTTGVNTMNTRNIRTINATLNDNDTNLALVDTLVFQKTLVRTEHSDEKTIQSLLMSGKVQAALEKHNSKREETVDKAILKATGVKVFLDPVEIWDLQWEIVTVA